MHAELEALLRLPMLAMATGGHVIMELFELRQATQATL